MGHHGWQFFFALLSLTRLSLYLGLLDRPLVAGFLISILTGDIFPAMYIAVFFELLWLDRIPTGTFIPPNSLFCTVSTILMVQTFGLSHTSQIFPIMVITIPVAYFCSWLESAHRITQNRNYNIILQQSRKTAARYKPGIMIGKALLQMFCLYLLVGITGMYVMFLIIDRGIALLPMDEALAWPHLILLAAISALAALRVKKAYISLVIVITGVTTWFFWQTMV
ncbi:PTS sugar transporter subunit IIC [Desulfonatronovibrio magnus]|uniref:PTS sugar transporter subunit IIC n=1 Tax=Desulfonatronovibrio magnus TaxID=698827 RepID=UPI0005EBB7CC|nr:PTS sugar transporter subunit IIC [Desulfonatronovibrio magnus]